MNNEGFYGTYTNFVHILQKQLRGFDLEVKVNKRYLKKRRVVILTMLVHLTIFFYRMMSVGFVI